MRNIAYLCRNIVEFVLFYHDIMKKKSPHLEKSPEMWTKSKNLDTLP